MTILSAQSLRSIRPLTPFVERTIFNGMSYGLSAASYDVRIAENVVLEPGGFALASTIERFNMPHDVAASVKDKSSWARRGLAVQNTFIDPGWQGYLTLELSNHHRMPDRPLFRMPWLRSSRRWNQFCQEMWKTEVERMTIRIPKGSPIAQIVFEFLDVETEQPYSGKYQNQDMGAQPARTENKPHPPAHEDDFEDENTGD